MDRRWTSKFNNLDEQERFASYLKNSAGVLERLNEIIAEIEVKLDDREVSLEAYENPSWAYKQADNNGYRRALRDILRLTVPDQKEI